MSITLYHSVESTCSQKVRLVMTEKSLEWHEIRLNLRTGDQFEPDYLKLNPKAVVPTLVHDEVVVRESSVINEYLEDAFPEPPLRPAKPAERARMRLLVKAFDDEVHPSIGVLSYAIFLRHQMNELKSPEELAEHFNKVADPMRRERQMRTHEVGLRSPAAPVAIATLARVVAQMEENMTTGPWLAGATYSLADAAAVPYMFRARSLHLDPLWTERPRVSDWLDRAVSRAESLSISDPWGSGSFRAMVAEHAARSRTETQILIASVSSEGRG